MFESISIYLPTPTATAAYAYDSTYCTLSNTTGTTTINHYDAGNSSINTGKTTAPYNYNEICDFHLGESRSNNKATYADSKMYYYGYRYYSPDLGKWVSRDPIGELGELNVYGFVKNDPVCSGDSLEMMRSVPYWPKEGCPDPENLDDPEMYYEAGEIYIRIEIESCQLYRCPMEKGHRICIEKWECKVQCVDGPPGQFPSTTVHYFRHQERTCTKCNPSIRV